MTDVAEHAVMRRRDAVERPPKRRGVGARELVCGSRRAQGRCDARRRRRRAVADNALDRSCHRASLVLERLPRFVAQDVVDHVDGALELVVARVEVRRDANAGVRPIVDDHVVREQRLRDAVRVRHVERDRSAATRTDRAAR